MKKIPLKGLVIEITAWAVFLLIFTMPAIFVMKGGDSYIGKGLLSTVISFGGGEAYLTIADSLFVTSGSISSDIFYGQILPIANALPGPILSKVLAGTGYVIGYHTTGDVMVGFLLSIAGYAVSLAASCGVFFFINYVYNSFESLNIFQILKKWILPIICGLLLSTIVAMLYENCNIIIERDLTKSVSFMVCGFIFGFLYLLHKKFHLHDLVLILISGVASLVVCNLI